MRLYMMSPACIVSGESPASIDVSVTTEAYLIQSVSTITKASGCSHSSEHF